MKAVVALALVGSALAYGPASSAKADPVVPSKAGYGDDWPEKSAAPVVPSKGSYGGDYDAGKKSSDSWPKPSGKPTWGDDDDEDCDDEDDGEWDDDKNWSKSGHAKPTWSKKGGDYDNGAKPTWSKDGEAKPTWSKKGGDYGNGAKPTWSKEADAKPTWSKGSWGGKDDEECTTKTWEESYETPVVKTMTTTDSWGKAYPTETTVIVKTTKTHTQTLTKSKGAEAWPTPAYFDLACCKSVVTVTVYESMGSKPTADGKPTWSAPAKPEWSAPAKPEYSAPSKPEWSAPAKPEWSAPAKPEWSAPSKPEYSAPSKPEWSAPAKPEWSSPAKPEASKPAYGGEGPIKTNGDKWGMTYTPYTPAGQCKTAAEVDADILKIKGYGFTTVRIYATDCDGLKNVGASTKKYDMKIILGVFIDNKGLQASWAQVDEIAAWGQANSWDNVVMVVVGNEAVFNGYCGAEDLAAYVKKVKVYLAEKGYKGWTTTTEPVNIIEQNKCLCDAMDVAAANIQPFFTSSIDAKNAGDFVLGQLAQVAAACPGKDAYNLECGWPHTGKNNGAAVPSKEDQKTALYDIVAKAGKKTCVFSYEDDSWKADGEFDVEKNWGCGDIWGSDAPAAPVKSAAPKPDYTAPKGY